MGFVQFAFTLPALTVLLQTEIPVLTLPLIGPVFWMAGEMVKKSLVIEDRAETRNLFLESIEAEGFYNIAAENGLVGVQRAIGELPNLIICGHYDAPTRGLWHPKHAAPKPCHGDYSLYFSYCQDYHD
jgi:hypothetical protein